MKKDTFPNTYRKTVTDKGIRVVTEHMDNVRSVAVGIWFVTGSRDETEEQNGISHFLEHMMFKGTEKRSALRIAREIEQVGGHLNAFTSKELTAYYANLLDERLPLAIDVLADMASNSKFVEKEIKREQGVVLEEIATSQDTPDDVVMEDFTTSLFPGDSLGRAILGAPETVSSFSRKDVTSYWNDHYTCDKAVVTAAGNVDHDKLVKLVDRKLLLPDSNNLKRKPFNGVPALTENFTRRKDIMQAHFCLGTRGIRYDDPRRYAFFLMNTVLGSGMSSRLFQRIREKNGLAYSIFSFHEAYTDNGLFAIYAATEEKYVSKAEKLALKEIDKLINIPLSTTELKRVKTQLKGGLMLGLESSAGRMHRLARGEIYMGQQIPLDELIERIDAVTTKDIQQIASDLFGSGFFAAYLLPENQRH
ncbi:MAG: pitrilysin family protein [Candidatus Electryonea clarkiae]|nr:pitrilysin family protein [Candidatus Electryonea clarkiae]MDP8286611.1 pitrilysin family protein [Candidatus Electryonea clarkiae]